jgi:hypothetical protein
MPRLRAVCAAALVALIGGAQAYAQSEAARIPLLYSIQFRGIEIVQLAIDAQVAATSYDVSVSAWTTGVFGGLYPWRLSATSQGRIDRGATIPVRHATESRLGRTTRRLEIDYRNGRIAAVRRTVTPPTEEVFEGVPEGERIDAVDGITAILAALLRAGNGSGCPQRLASFDGRRLLEVSFVQRPNLQPVAAAGLTCEFQSDSRDRPLSGHQRRWRAGRLVMAAADANGRAVPARIETETRWGNAAAVLLAANGVRESGAGRR